MMQFQQDFQEEEIDPFECPVGVEKMQDEEMDNSQEEDNASTFDESFGKTKPMKCLKPNYAKIFTANHELPAYRSSLKFPPSRELYQYIQNQTRLKELLSAQLKRLGLYIEVRVVQSRVSLAIHVICISCGRKLLMKYLFQHADGEAPKYKLVHFDNTHIHDGDTRFRLNRQSRFHLLMQEYKQHSNMTLDEFYKYLKKKFQMSKKELRYFLTNIMEKRDEEMKALVEFLKKNNSRIWMVDCIAGKPISECEEFKEKDSYPKDPEFFMFSLPFMVENCKQFHSICYISIVPGFIQNKDKNGKKNWEIISFAGLNNCNDLAPFAIAFLDNSQHFPNTISSIVLKFFQDFAVCPNIIVTPQGQLYNDVVLNLRTSCMNFRGLHLFDAICYLEVLGEQLDDLVDRIHYQRILLSKTRKDFNDKCQNLFKRVEPSCKNMEIFNRMVSLAPKMIFPEIETYEFIGLTFRFSASKHFLNLMRQIFTKGKVTQVEQQPVGCVVRKRWKNMEPSLIKSVFLVARSMLKLDHFLNSETSRKSGYCLWRCENYMDLPEIENLRINIRKDYLDLLLEEYGHIFQIQACQRELKDPLRPEMKIFDVYDRRLKSIFVVSAQPEYNTETRELTNFRWRCNCLYSFKSGLPCAHEVKVCVLTDSSLFPQINQKWLKMRFFPPNMKKRGRTKGTRRNTEK